MLQLPADLKIYRKKSSPKVSRAWCTYSDPNYDESFALTNCSSDRNNTCPSFYFSICRCNNPFYTYEKRKNFFFIFPLHCVGVAGFEPTTLLPSAGYANLVNPLNIVLCLFSLFSIPMLQLPADLKIYRKKSSPKVSRAWCTYSDPNYDESFALTNCSSDRNNTCPSFYFSICRCNNPFYTYEKRKNFFFIFPLHCVGVAGFEPTTPCSQSRCANRTALHPVLIF